MTKRLFLLSYFVLAFIILSCASDVKDALDETADSIRCAELVRELDAKNDADPDRDCSEIVDDIDEIERTCNEFLSESTKEQFQELRDACATAG